jgi:hypothetical protein
MTREHFFPRWLINYAGVHNEGIWWIHDEEEKVGAESATIPLCGECNHTFGTTLEGPVAEIFRQLEDGAAISEDEAELLVRWLWKFEGLQWTAVKNDPNGRYTSRYTLRERIETSRVFNEVRDSMVLAIALAHSNDRNEWPMGLDTPVSENALTMSGVFGRVALICSLSQFADIIPDVYGKFFFGSPVAKRANKVFLPPMSFIHAYAGAVDMTRVVGHMLAGLHDEWARRQPPSIRPVRHRIELPYIGRSFNGA